MLYFLSVVAAVLLGTASTGFGFVSSSISANRPATSLSYIKNVFAREIIDSRGNPTVEVDVKTDNGLFRASVPSGASTGVHEACELRDGGSRYLGKGVQKACRNINEILGPGLLGMDETQQEEIDRWMLRADGTSNKANMGANAILGVSLAVARAGAAKRGVPLYRHFADLAGNNKELMMPVPSFNVINGGSHAGNALEFQEFMILPTGAGSFKESMQIGAEIYHTLKDVTKKRYGKDAVNVGDEGGFAPPIQSNKEGIELLMNAIDKSGHSDKVVLGIDVASSEFYDGEKYDLIKKSRKPGSIEPKLSGEEMAKFYKDLCSQFPIKSIEDPFDQDDWESWVRLTKEIGRDVQIIGDDLTVTNPQRIETAANLRACNGLLLKVNQIGSVTESIDAVKLSKHNGWGVMASHRSGETEDNYIADLAVGLCAGQIKTGAPCRSERLSKYNQLLRIEEEIGGKQPMYAGKAFRKPIWMG